MDLHMPHISHIPHPHLERRKEMFGWSAPPHIANAAPGQWADSAFDTLAEQLKVLQLDAERHAEAAADQVGTDRVAGEVVEQPRQR